MKLKCTVLRPTTSKSLVKKQKTPIANAPTGSLDSASGHPSQFLAFGVVLVHNNKPLVKGDLYSIAATGMSPIMNMQYDHNQPGGGPWVFYELPSTKSKE